MTKQKTGSKARKPTAADRCTGPHTARAPRSPWRNHRQFSAFHGRGATPSSLDALFHRKSQSKLDDCLEIFGNPIKLDDLWMIYG